MTCTSSSSRSVRIVALTVATGVAVAIAAMPASAKPAAPDAKINRSQGIDRAAGTVTLHDGTVIRGITFVDMKDVPRIRQQRAASTSLQGTTSGGQWVCLPDWHYIRAGGSNTYWEPGVFGYIYANSNPSVNPWNQWFLPCFYTDWEINAWAFLANLGKRVVTHTPDQLRASVEQPPFLPEDQFTYHTKIRVCHFDGNWIYLYLHNNLAGTKVYAFRDAANGGVFRKIGPLTGDYLFRIEPSIGDGPC